MPVTPHYTFIVIIIANITTINCSEYQRKRLELLAVVRKKSTCIAENTQENILMWTEWAEMDKTHC